MKINLIFLFIIQILWYDADFDLTLFIVKVIPALLNKNWLYNAEIDYIIDEYFTLTSDGTEIQNS